MMTHELMPHQIFFSLKRTLTKITDKFPLLSMHFTNVSLQNPPTSTRVPLGIREERAVGTGNTFY